MIEVSSIARSESRKLRTFLAKTPLQKEEIVLLKQETADYYHTPRCLSFHHYKFYFFTRIYRFFQGRELVILGLMSNGTLHWSKWHYETDPPIYPTPRTPLPQRDCIQINNLWSQEFHKFVNVSLLQQAFDAHLDSYHFALVMEQSCGSETSINSLLRDHLCTIFTSALKAFLEEITVCDFNPENPTSSFSQLTLQDWLTQYYYLPLQRSCALRDEIAARFTFAFDPLRQVFFKRNSAHEVVINRKGDVHIDGSPVCITIKSPTSLPANDIIVCKFFALGDPHLRHQISTLTPFYPLLEDLFDEKNSG